MRHLEGNIFIKEDGGSSGSAPATGATIGSPTPYQGSGVGIKRPQAMKPRKKKENKEYDGCDCATCKELNVNCDNCPVCQANEKADNLFEDSPFKMVK
jgi:hypothetical protein